MALSVLAFALPYRHYNEHVSNSHHGVGFVTCDTPQQMHTISEMARISSFIINLGDHHINDGQAVGFTCCSSFVVYNAATHSTLTRCDDALLYHFDVPLQMLVIMDYIFL